jgi:hypothetical protein
VRQGLCLALAHCVAWASDADKQVGGHRRLNATQAIGGGGLTAADGPAPFRWRESCSSARAHRIPSGA